MTQIVKNFLGNNVTFNNVSVIFSTSEPASSHKITPNISSITNSGVEITFSTTELTNTKIVFDQENCPPGACELTDSTYLLSHVVKINNLLSSNTYKFKVVATTQAGGVYESDYITITTLPQVVSQPDFPTQPPSSVVNGINSSYNWNLEKEKTFLLTFDVSPNTTYVKYYFPNQQTNNKDGYTLVNVPVTTNTTSTVTIEIQPPDVLGIYELAIVPGNSTIGDGIISRTQVNLYKEVFYGEPDITSIQYNKHIVEADLLPLGFNFDFQLKTVNADGIEVFIGNIQTPIDTINVTDNTAKISYNAKDFYTAYSTQFNKTEKEYVVTFSFRPFFYGIKGKYSGKLETVTTTVTRTQFTITREQAISSFSSAFTKLFSGDDTKKEYLDKITFEDDKHLYYRVKYQNSPFDAFVITNIAKDDITFSLENGIIVNTEFIVDVDTGNTVRKQKTPYSSLVVKLLEPLPVTIPDNSQIWISKQIIPSVIEDIVITDEDISECIQLKPNFNVDVADETGFYYFNEIIASGSATSTQIVNTYVSKSLFSLEELNINYTSGSDTSSEVFLQFENFINFSSAVTRLNNYQYKLSAIEFWNTKINTTLYSGSTPSTSSYSIITSQSYATNINNVKTGFDAFEKTLYYDFQITGSNNSFFTIQNEYADEFDRSNPNYLVRHIPSYLKESSDDNSEYVLFLEMIGQHYDVLWSYIKGIAKSKRITNTPIDGVSDNLVHTLLENLGWDPRYPFSGHQLWREAFGVDVNGNTITNKNLLGNNIVSSYTPETARVEVWRRLLNNLPYLLKNKGTRRALNAIMTCYGVPSSLLTIIEFGGPSTVDPEELRPYTYEDRSANLKIKETEYIAIPWKYTSSSPEAVQVRFKTTNQLSSSYVTGSQILREVSGSGTYWSVNLIPSGGGYLGNVSFTITGSKKTFTSPSSSLTTPFSSSMLITGSVLFDGDWKNLTIQRETFTSGSPVLSYSRFTLHLKEAVESRIIMSQSATLVLQTSSSNANISGNEYYSNLPWTSDGILYIGSDTLGRKGISGSIDEVRVWNTALSESIITSHTLNPDVIYGNGIYSSTNNLLVRLDFEYPKDRTLDPYIKNVSPAVTFLTTTASNGTTNISSGYTGYATASITTTSTTYPYQYEVYSRVVSAQVPTIGFVGNDKTRLEEITLTTNLSHLSRSTKKAFDRAPVDSNKLGLFFSPVKELNLDILKSLGPLNIGDYIGDWSEEYNTTKYDDLTLLRNYYFQRTNVNFYEYINLVKSIDKSLFEMFDQVIPARTHVVKGLLLEPSLLERSKIQINRPIVENTIHSSSVDLTDSYNLEYVNVDYEAAVDYNEDITFTSSIDSSITEINFSTLLVVDSTTPSYTSSINFIGVNTVYPEIIYNSGSTMGGVEISIDAGVSTSTIQGEYEIEGGFTGVGNDPDSPFIKGFGVVGENGAVDRTYIKSNGTFVPTERNNAYILTVMYTRDVPTTTIDGVTTYEKVSKYQKKLCFISQSDDNNGGVFRGPLEHSFYTYITASLGTYPYDNGVVTEIYPFDGYTTGHYRYTKDTSRGLENSYFRGSKQTALTTTDGAAAVEVFATNPNTLKVSETGRNSGEPILIVE